jgi:hypothetical protein
MLAKARLTMKAKPIDVAELSDAKVCSLLALGLSPQSSPITPSPLDLFREAVADPSRRKLRVLVSDLQSPVYVPDDGPLSFRRLTEMPDKDAAQFEGKTLIKMLTSSRTTREALLHLARFGEILSAEGLPNATRLTGFVVRSLALRALVTRYAASLEPLDAQATTEVLQTLVSTQTVPKPLRDYAHHQSTR